jgi:hypothetical protein
MPGEVQKTFGELAHDGRSEPNPLLSLPQGFGVPVARLVKSYGYAFRSNETLVWKIVDWHERHGLTADDLVIIEVLMSAPEVSREINFEANFFASFSEKAAVVMARRRSLEAQEERRRDPQPVDPRTGREIFRMHDKYRAMLQERLPSWDKLVKGVDS